MRPTQPSPIPHPTPQPPNPQPPNPPHPHPPPRPIMKFPYKRNDLQEIGMVAGGTGEPPAGDSGQQAAAQLTAPGPGAAAPRPGPCLAGRPSAPLPPPQLHAHAAPAPSPPPPPGITPMLQVVEWILRDPSDKTKVSLVFGNGTRGGLRGAWWRGGGGGRRPWAPVGSAAPASGAAAAARPARLLVFDPPSPSCPQPLARPPTRPLPHASLRGRHPAEEPPRRARGEAPRPL
jgi:hypothetical protein